MNVVLRTASVHFGCLIGCHLPAILLILVLCFETDLPSSTLRGVVFDRETKDVLSLHIDNYYLSYPVYATCAPGRLPTSKPTDGWEAQVSVNSYCRVGPRPTFASVAVLWADVLQS